MTSERRLIRSEDIVEQPYSAVNADPQRVFRFSFPCSVTVGRLMETRWSKEERKPGGQRQKMAKKKRNTQVKSIYSFVRRITHTEVELKKSMHLCDFGVHEFLQATTEKKKSERMGCQPRRATVVPLQRCLRLLRYRIIE